MLARSFLPPDVHWLLTWSDAPTRVMTTISATSFSTLVSNRAKMARADMIDKIQDSAVCDVVGWKPPPSHG